MKLVLLRHGMTFGNEKKRYIGITDEDLSEQGKAQVEILKEQLLLEGVLGKEVKKMYVAVSPMKRCRQTAELLNLWKTEEKEDQCIATIVDDRLRECDFGLFENKNYLELKEEPLYQKWIDSNGTMDFPEGDNIVKWKERCQQAFVFHMKKAEEQGYEQIVFVIHGGSIMAIMERFDEEEKGYYDYHVENANGYLCQVKNMCICRKRKICG